MLYPMIRSPLINPFLLWTELSMKTAEMLVASGQVIAARSDRFRRAGANPGMRDLREFALMGSEKIKAASESGLAVAARLQQTNYALLARAWQQWFASLAAMNALATSRSFGQALARQNRLFGALGRSGHAQARLSSATARLAGAALKPVHGASTANARRLARAKAGKASR